MNATGNIRRKAVPVVGVAAAAAIDSSLLSVAICSTANQGMTAGDGRSNQRANHQLVLLLLLLLLSPSLDTPTTNTTTTTIGIGPCSGGPAATSFFRFARLQHHGVNDGWGCTSAKEKRVLLLLTDVVFVRFQCC